MRVIIASVLLSLGLAGAFAPTPRCFSRSSVSPRMAADKDVIDAKIAELAAAADKWRATKKMDPEQAEKELKGDELTAYKAYHAQLKEDLEAITGVAELFAKQIDFKVLKPKGKNQRKRDAYVRKMARQGIKVEPKGYVAQE